MTKREALDILYEHEDLFDDSPKFKDALTVAIDALEELIDIHDSPCYDCDKSHCHNCLYSGRIY